MVDIIIGFMVGILSSMGFGGGSILLLYLTMFRQVDQRTAAGINLIFFLPCAALSTILFVKNKVLKKEILLPLMVCSAVGAVLGAWLSMGIEIQILRKGFGVYLLIMGVKDFFSKRENPHSSAK